MNMEMTNLRMKYKSALFVPIKQTNIVKNVTHIIVASTVKEMIGHDIKSNVNAYRNYIHYLLNIIKYV